MTIAGTHTAQNPINLVLKAPQDLAFSIDQKREKMRLRQYAVIGCIEQIIFENDKDCALDTPEARRVGRRIYWPERCPLIARTKPEEDLVFTQPIKLPLPDVPDPLDVIKNPYRVNRRGESGLPIDQVDAPGRIKQRLERIASAKYRNFLVFHPIAQIIVLMVDPKAGVGKPGMIFGAFGSHKLPLSSLSGFDGRKMALLMDPYTGEAYFTGGRYQFDVRG